MKVQERRKYMHALSLLLLLKLNFYFCSELPSSQRKFAQGNIPAPPIVMNIK